MGITEPTVRAGERLRRNRRRLPPGVPTITVRIDDHRSGTMYASFASPDGKQWASYGYWPAQERVPLDRLEWDADGSVWET